VAVFVMPPLVKWPGIEQSPPADRRPKVTVKTDQTMEKLIKCGLRTGRLMAGLYADVTPEAALKPKLEPAAGMELRFDLVAWRRIQRRLAGSAVLLSRVLVCASPSSPVKHARAYATGFHQSWI